jgi:hypothetical protein
MYVLAWLGLPLIDVSCTHVVMWWMQASTCAASSGHVSSTQACPLLVVMADRHAVLLLCQHRQPCYKCMRWPPPAVAIVVSLAACACSWCSACVAHVVCHDQVCGWQAVATYTYVYCTM